MNLRCVETMSARDGTWSLKEIEHALCLDIHLVTFYIVLFLQDIERFADEVFPVRSEVKFERLLLDG